MTVDQVNALREQAIIDGECVLDGERMTIAELDRIMTKEWQAAIIVDNAVLPKHLQGKKERGRFNDVEQIGPFRVNVGDHVNYGQTGTVIAREYDKLEAKRVKQAAKIKAKNDKNTRLARYAAQVDGGMPIFYEKDDDTLYRHQLAFAGARLELED